MTPWIRICWRRAAYRLKKSLLWRGQHRPARMFRNSRPVDPGFATTERLFLRCTRDMIDENGRMKVSAVAFPNQSVNRGKYSRPSDVLLPELRPGAGDWILWGVVEFAVMDIPETIESTGGVATTFGVEHEPTNDNYSHSELSASKGGKRQHRSKAINIEVKKEYRTRLAQETRLIIRALVSAIEDSEPAEA